MYVWPSTHNGQLNTSIYVYTLYTLGVGYVCIHRDREVMHNFVIS